MNDFLTRLKQRKLVQWAIAYVAFAFALIQALDVVSGSYHWPDGVMHLVFGALVLGLVVALVLAWYHGERGAQRVSGAELLLIALALAIGGGLLWHFARAPSDATAAAEVASIHGPNATRRNPGSTSSTATARAPVSDVSTSASVANAASSITAQAIPAKSIAVLPFENLSTDKSNAYFADGMQDLILTKLADIGDLKVISRTSTMQYGSHPQNLKVIAQQLGVATILEGSVQKAGNQVLINVQLIDANTDSHIWAESYTRSLDNIFGVEGEVAQKVADALDAKLTTAETAAIAKVPTRNKGAYQAYLKAIYYLDDANRTNDVGELEKSIALTKQAVAADPNFVDAWALMALGYQKVGNHNDDAEKAALRALAIDPDNASAHAEYALALMNRREFKTAIAQAQEGVHLKPNAGYVHDALGFVYLAAGNLEKADAAFVRAVQVDPKIDFSREWVANIEMMRRDYATARDKYQNVVVNDPADVIAATTLANVYELGWGDLDEARKALQDVPTPVSSSGTLSDAWYWLDLYARDYPAALTVIEHAPPSWFQQTNQPLALYQARVYRARGGGKQAEQAFTQARALIEARIKSAPQDAAAHAHMALTLAGLDDGDGAVAEAQRAVQLADVFTGNQYLLNLATVEVWTGKTGAGLQLLDELLGKPTGDVISVSLLKLDPAWDPIRHDPRFQALLKKYVNAAPVSASSTTIEQGVDP